MRQINKRLFVFLLASTLLISSCATLNNTAKGGLFGAAGGATLGAGIGAIAGGGKGAAIGAAIGTVVGTGAGVAIGNKMDKQKAELAKINGAEVETVKDNNNLEAIKVTFADGILFPTGKSELNAGSRTALIDFANSLKNNPNTDVTIYGHTDNTGSRSINEKLSTDRATAVANFLVGNGVSRDRIKTEGLAYDAPVADNSTVDGRAKNRRVEIFISANAKMIEQAQKGTL